MDLTFLDFSTPEDARPGAEPTQASRRCGTGFMLTDGSDCAACGAQRHAPCRDPDGGLL